ncbi:hypothetical protein PR202_gb24065 [Eleusine coracana subsp. coracana]|uniref:Leucine-rich repeat-containing N-terminal plant-type domain-containing protein n=1 Tax=Eleusine coracana subsp. coracana TaxID=191504 RepID=A0AAV5FLL8_ELECO|nr:hypothetical protein PR202_gb24065 [Eleusine coracana subsp. coracana]
MHATATPLLVLLPVICTTIFLTGAAIQLQHPDGKSCIPAERDALLSFKKGITSDPANRLSSWHGQDCCRWSGVRCSNETGHVLKLHLRNQYRGAGFLNGCGDVNALLGQISPSLLSLEQLEHMDLSMNCFTGRNNLSGVIPRHVSNLTAMTLKGSTTLFALELSFPYGDGNIYIGAKISGQFGEILSIITKGQQLRYGNALEHFVSIDLSGNFLSGEIPTGITSLDALINLNLSSNCLRGNIPNKIGDMRSLESLDLSKNKFFGEIPSSLSNLTSLSYMNLSYNNLSGRIPSSRQLDTLGADDPSLMYISNNGLCGPPLLKSCSINDNVVHGNQRSSRQQALELMLFDLGLMLGLAAGLWMVFCALLFMKTWRIAYLQLIDKMSDRI